MLEITDHRLLVLSRAKPSQAQSAMSQAHVPLITPARSNILLSVLHVYQATVVSHKSAPANVDTYLTNFRQMINLVVALFTHINQIQYNLYHMTTMKLSIATTLFLLSEKVFSLTINGAPKKLPSMTTKPTSPTTALNFIDERLDTDLDLFFLEDLSLVVDPVTRALANSLGVTDEMVRAEYNDWLMYYDKVPDESRYPIFKRNWLLQEDYNRMVGIDLALNEFGDCTEGKERLGDDYFGSYDKYCFCVISHTTTFNWPSIVLEEYFEQISYFADNTNDAVEDEVPINELQVDEGHFETAIDVTKYEVYESVEDRAFHLLEDIGFLTTPNKHYAVSYLDVIPELGTHGTTYLEKLLIPSHSAFIGDRALPTAYLESLPPSQFSTFAKGKVGVKLGAALNYFEEICALISPFLGTSAHDRAQIQPKSPEADKHLQQKYAAIKNLGDRAFQILVDLCTERGSCGQQS